MQSLLATRLCAGALAVFAWVPCLCAQTNLEIRALWVDTFHAGMRSPSEVSALVAAARDAQCNAVIVEVRKRADAYYNSNFEPKATDVTTGFDPLADLINKARSGGPRIEVHAWITTYLAWNNQSTPPSQPNHPYNLHPDWLSQDVNSNKWDGANYQFDQAHPEVQKHVFNVAMDIMSNYDVDGFHFDYVRYTGNTWGYHPIAVERFNRLAGRSGKPAFSDSAWLQFRRDQVSALVRKVYLNAIALKPQMKVSAATICFAPGITTDAQWFSSSAAWNNVLQDWRGWMQEGLLDLNVPMMYFDQRRYSNDWAAWSIFAKDHTYGHHVALGQASYLNILSNTIYQLRSTRTVAASNAAHGMALYSYAVPDTNLAQSVVYDAFTQPSPYDPDPVPIFTNIVSAPVMLWKSTPTRGHLMGTIRSAATNGELDGATVSIAGPTPASRPSDATGFYGFAHLRPGNYTVTVSYSNHVTQSTNVIISTGTVTTLDFALAPSVAPFNVRVTAGMTEAIVGWDTALAGDSQVAFGLTTNVGDATWRSSWRDPAPLTNHVTLLTALMRNTNYFFQALSQIGTNLVTSPLLTFSTSGDIIIDNTSATLTGTWTPGTSSLDKYGTNYLFASSGSGAAATFTPLVDSPGYYDVYVWYPQGGNRSTNAPWVLVFNGGTNSGVINQTTGGGGWRLIATNTPFASGTSGYFQWQTVPSEAGKVVMADAVRLVYLLPLPGEIPSWWSHFFYGGTIDGNSDTDGDDSPAGAEYIAGTDPTRASSHLQFGIRDRTNNAVRVSFAPFHLGRAYDLQAEAKLGGAGWSTINSSPQQSPGGDGVFAITNAPGGEKFYRLRVRLP